MYLLDSMHVKCSDNILKGYAITNLSIIEKAIVGAWLQNYPVPETLCIIVFVSMADWSNRMSFRCTLR